MKKLPIIILCTFFVSVSFTQTLPPTITSFSPTSGPIGTIVTITGTNFSTTASNNVVYFGAVKAQVTAASSTSLTVTVPTGATYQPITETNVTTNLTAYSTKPFIVTFQSSRVINVNSFSPKVDFPLNKWVEHVSIGDLDGDGKPDIAVTDGNYVSLFRNTTTSGSFSSSSFGTRIDLYVTAGQAGDPEMGDLNGDGKLDLAVANWFGNTVSVFLNTSSNGNISFAPKIDLEADSNAATVMIRDIDGDGKPDIVVTNQLNATVSVYRNTSSDSTLSFALRIDFITGDGPGDLFIGDLDGDGKLDLAVSNHNSNTVSILRNTSVSGNISFAPKVDISTGINPYVNTIGDLDGDGKLDIAVAAYNDNIVSVFRNTSTSGTISFAPKVDFATGGSPWGLAISDLDGDGKPDIVVVNSNSQSVSVFRNMSTTGSITNSSFATKVDFATGVTPWIIAIGDLDGDGKPDLVVTNFGGSISLLRNTIGPLLAPTIVSVKDVPNDNGKQVWVRWSISAPPASNNITSFGVWRNDSIWTYVMETKTTNDTIYQVVAPTLFDSTKSKGQYLTPFRVTAHTPDPSLFYTSQPMSGYSLDNLPPLAPTAVTGTTLAGGYRISWKPAINQFNDFKNYILYRSENASAGPSVSTKLADVLDTVYNDKTVQVGKVYYYKVTSIDYSGNESMPASLTANMTSVNKEDGAIPEVFGLDQNYPNPFNPSTTIQYGLPVRSAVRLVIYDMLGQVVSELINSEQQAGYQSVVWNANIASGLYFYRLEATSLDNPSKRFVETKKMLLLK